MLILFELLRFGGNHIIASGCVTTPKQKGFNERPELLEASMFAKDISQILLPINMEETENLGCNSFTHTMIRQCIVAFVQSKVRYSRTSDNGIVIIKHNNYNTLIIEVNFYLVRV